MNPELVQEKEARGFFVCAPAIGASDEQGGSRPEKIGGAPAPAAVRDPRSGERGLIVEIHPEISEGPTEQELRAFEERLFDASIRVGLYVTPSRLFVVRDLLRALEFASNRFERTPFNTEELLQAARLRKPRGPEELHERIREYLVILPETWMSSLSHEAVAAMVPDVIGHLFQAELETVDDVLPQYAASA